VPGAPGYQVSDFGHVRSVDRTLADGRLAGGVLLTPWKDGKGYWRVSLSVDGKRRTPRVHRLVKAAFTGPARGRQVRHRRDDKDDLRLVALLYGTQRDNERDKRRNRRLKGKEGQEKQER
jgi:NUMOD4 motif